MKKILLILSTVAFLASCQDKTTYTLKGKVEGVEDGTKVYLYEDLLRRVVTDSTTVKDNQFIFEGKLDKPVMRSLKVEGLGLKQEEVAEGVDASTTVCVSCLAVLEPGKTIKLTLDGKGRIIKNNGSPLMNKHRDFWANMGTTRTPDSEYLIEMIKENKDNAMGIFYFINVIEIAYPDSKSLKELYTLFSDKRGEDKRLDEMLDYIMNLDNIAAIGTKYTDIKAKTPDGQDIALSDYVGKKKAVLLHFFQWSGLASDKDYTYLRNAYAKYKDKRFEIVGIWLDSNTKTWKDVIDEENMTWLQMCDTKQIIQLIKTYAVFDEPRTILIDKDGTIIAREIPRTELDTELSKLLK